jgi:hypothetical protein
MQSAGSVRPVADLELMSIRKKPERVTKSRLLTKLNCMLSLAHNSYLKAVTRSYSA